MAYTYMTYTFADEMIRTDRIKYTVMNS